jgi:hypothetical protein
MKYHIETNHSDWDTPVLRFCKFFRIVWMVYSSIIFCKRKDCVQIFIVFQTDSYLAYVYTKRPVSVTERSEGSTVFGRSNVEIAGLNPARVMDMCLRFSVLCCPVCT